MKNDELKNNPYWQITLLSSRLKHDVAQVAEQHGLAPSQMHALLLVEPKKQIAMNQLSCMISCDASYITSIVDKLTNLGYIRRQESSLDRRIKTIELTKEGVVFRAKLIRDFNDFYRHQSQLQDIGTDITDALEKIVAITTVKAINKNTPTT